MSSIRRDLATYLSLGVGVVFLFAGWLLWMLFRTNSREDFDSALLAKAGALATLLECQKDGIEFDFADEVMPEFHRAHDPEYFQIWIRDGALLERSLSLKDLDLPRRVGPVNAPVFWDLQLPDGRPGRAVGLTSPVDFADEADVDHRRHDVFAETVVAVSREDLEHGIAVMLHALWITAAALVGAGIAVVGVALHRVQRRFRALTDQLDDVDSDSLEARIETETLVAELRPLADTVNLLLERLQRSFAREKRMTSNIAHELRTPVAELRTAVEVARTWPEDLELTSNALAVASGVSVRMTSTIETLLRLGRLHNNGGTLEITEFDLAVLIREIEAELAPELQRRGCRIEHVGEKKAIEQADKPLARVLVRNLLDNALAHSASGSRIESELRRTQDELRWRLGNPVTDLTAEDVCNFSEPFWQKESSRTSERHPGLGLSLCRTICMALDWRLSFELESGVLHVLVEIPDPSAKKRIRTS